MAKSTALTKIMMVAVGRWQMLEQLEASLEQLNARQQLTNLVHAVLQVGALGLSRFNNFHQAAARAAGR